MRDFEPGDQARIIASLVVKFTAQYGALWSSRFNDPDMAEAMQEEWRQSLSGFWPEVIVEATDRCKSDYPNSPPTLGQFCYLCRMLTQDRIMRFKPLPEPPRNLEVGRKHLEQIERMLGIDRTRTHA